MKITYNHPLAKHGLVVGQQFIHNGLTYEVTAEDFGVYEIERKSYLTIWRGKTVY
jgi:hypothetical protein